MIPTPSTAHEDALSAARGAKRRRTGPDSIHPKTLRGRFHCHGLTIVLAGIFLSLVVAESIAGYFAFSGEREEFHEPPISYWRYLGSGHFLESLGENWESEFLQMGAFITLTACLYQKGSPESKNPFDPQKEHVETTAMSPWPVRRGGWALWFYERSLATAMFLLFFACFALHAYFGTWKYNHEQARFGKPPVGMMQFVATSDFWFQSFQNWESEFLIVCQVVLAIYLRQKNSPESKPVAMPSWQNE